MGKRVRRRREESRMGKRVRRREEGKREESKSEEGSEKTRGMKEGRNNLKRNLECGIIVRRREEEEGKTQRIEKGVRRRESKAGMEASEEWEECEREDGSKEKSDEGKNGEEREREEERGQS